MTNQEEIQFLISSHGIKLNWLADQLDLKIQTLSYLIYESPKLDDDLYVKIKESIEAYQYELSFYDNKQIESYDLFTDERIHIGMGDRIRIFAKRKYGTLKSLAEAMEISPQQLQQYISGNREPGSKILARLLRLGCDINWLLGGTEKAESYRVYKLENDLKKLQESFTKIISIIEETNNKI